MTTFSPEHDGSIAQKYSVKTLEQKVQNKTALQKKLGWPSEPKRPVVCLPVGMSDALGGELFMNVLPGLMELPIELLVLGKGSNSFGELFTKMQKEKSHRIAIIPAKDHDRSEMYAASDIALFFADPASLPELNHCLQYGVVPISPATPLLESYDPVQERGNAFTYEKLNQWHAFAALARALETFKFPFDWRTIQRHCMDSVLVKA